MEIDVNKNIEEYRDDFFHGLSKKQTLTAAVTITLGSAIILGLTYGAGLPLMSAAYIAIPFSVPVALLGFMRINGMTLPVYLKRMMLVRKSKPYIYEAEEALYIIEEPKKEMEKPKQKKIKKVRVETILPEKQIVDHSEIKRAEREKKRCMKELERRRKREKHKEQKELERLNHRMAELKKRRMRAERKVAAMQNKKDKTGM